MSSLEFMQYRCPKDNILIAGMAGNYDDALELVRIILQDAYESKMEDDICAFLENRERENNMLHLLLLILKIAGIILAIILGILIVLLCIVLFVPVCYQVSGENGRNRKGDKGKM